tara:strand:+ start:171 stop:425 length:255 start_codon:yes stop_codon:yes gene_type:complete
MKQISLILLILLSVITSQAQDSNRPPEITNVVAQQVEITYNLLDRDGDLMTVSLQVSSDSAGNFDPEARSLTGQIGEGIDSGSW